MFIPHSEKVYFVAGATDMRKGIDGLLAEVAAHDDLNALDGSLFVFCSRNRRQIKVLYWDRNGFALYQKRLEKEYFKWPSNNSTQFVLSTRELQLLLYGLNPINNHIFKNLYYQTVK